jgi:GNAT superfamily N-acetyltransferase
MTDYSLKPASAADKLWLDELRRDAYRDLFNATWGGWDEARHQRHFAETWQAGQISIIDVDGHRAGMLQVFELPQSTEVGEIQIHPDFQGAGLGTRVLNDVIAASKGLGKPVTLYLGLKNARAHKLYLRLGFRETGRSDTHIFMKHRQGGVTSTPRPDG